MWVFRMYGKKLHCDFSPPQRDFVNDSAFDRKMNFIIDSHENCFYVFRGFSFSMYF